jgi:hypothetical protein
MGILQRLSKGCDGFRMSLYADDATLFTAPSEKEFLVITEILKMFAVASGLNTNITMAEICPIQCDNWNLSIQNPSGMILSSFPCKYLGLPLHLKMPKSLLQPLVQKIVDRLSGWKRGFFSYLGRKILVKFVLSIMPTYFLTVHKKHKWAYAMIEKFRRGFLWRGKDHAHLKGGHCLVNWKTCCQRDGGIRNQRLK